MNNIVRANHQHFGIQRVPEGAAVLHRVKSVAAVPVARATTSALPLRRAIARAGELAACVVDCGWKDDVSVAAALLLAVKGAQRLGMSREAIHAAVDEVFDKAWKIPTPVAG
jgi:hypothetical protein